MQEKTLSRIVRRKSRSLILLAGLAVAIWTFLKVIPNHGGTPRAPDAAAPQEVVDTAGQDYYRDAFTLIDLPPEDLVDAIPELGGLAPAAGQQELPGLLARMWDGVEGAFRKFTEVIADEHVAQEQCDPYGHRRTTPGQDFRYLIVPHIGAQNEHVDEYRVGRDGKALPASAAGLSFGQGFAAMWALLHPGDQSGSRFRYLGEQEVDRRTVDVLGFAQRPGWATVVGYENLAVTGERVPELYQGIVWVDKGTNKVMKMRAELLKPRLDIQLEMQTTEIQFGEVHLSDAASTALWVPLRVSVTTVWDGHTLRDEHVYSNYRLPQANSVIVPVPAKPVALPHDEH